MSTGTAAISRVTAPAVRREYQAALRRAVAVGLVTEGSPGYLWALARVPTVTEARAAVGC